MIECTQVYEILHNQLVVPQFHLEPLYSLLVVTKEKCPAQKPSNLLNVTPIYGSGVHGCVPLGSPNLISQYSLMS